MERISANQRLEQWKLLLRLSNQAPPLNIQGGSIGIDTHHRTQIRQRNGSGKLKQHLSESKEAEDPFDCSDLIIPDSKGLVKKTLESHLKEWEDLDSRIVMEDMDTSPPSSRKGRNQRKRHNPDDNEGNDDEEEVDENVDNQEPQEGAGNISHDDFDGGQEAAIVTAPMAGDYAGMNWGFHANRIRLPDFFDYTSKGPQPPRSQSPRLEEGQDQQQDQARRVIQVKPPKRRRVISLEDPTQRLDYESELWKIFQKVPMEADIEASAVEGAICTHSLALNKEIEEGYKDYTRLDGHALSRLRKKDRHHWPRMRTRRKRNMLGEATNTKGKEQVNKTTTEIDCATIKMELWKQQVKRFGPDPNKCEMEFLSTQTLQDVHNAIVELSEDDLFRKGFELRNSSNSISTSGVTRIPKQPSSSSGYFFVEETFYSTGDVDYVTPVKTWLNKNFTKKNKFSKNRKKYLKINPTVELQQKQMRDIQLGDIIFRLGIRYVHVFNGDCETAIFFTDVTMRTTDEITPKSSYPLLHDVWTMTTASLVHGVSVCHGCDYCPAAVVTIEDELCDGGPTPLCTACFRKLHYVKQDDGGDFVLRNNNFKVVPMSILQNLKDLSVWHDPKDAPF